MKAADCERLRAGRFTRAPVVLEDETNRQYGLDV